MLYSLVNLETFTQDSKLSIESLRGSFDFALKLQSESESESESEGKGGLMQFDCAKKADGL